MAPCLAAIASERIPALDPRDAAAEANHRIANHLSIIAGYVRSEALSLSQQKTPDFLSIRRSLQQLSLRIDAIGRLHRLLTRSSPAADVAICSYLREIADAACCSLARSERIRISFRFATEAFVTAKQAVAIGAIVSEALVNSIKYAHPDDAPGVISIGCKRTRCNKLIVEIEDDGAGRPVEMDAPRRHAGSGSSLMRILARSLNAHLEMIDAGPGYIVRVEVPLADQPSNGKQEA